MIISNNGHILQLRIRSDAGEIVCSLFDDIYPVLIRAFIETPIGDAKFYQCNYFPRMDIGHALQTDEHRFALIFEPVGDDADRYYLTYFEHGDLSYICFTDEQFSFGYIIGVVTSGNSRVYTAREFAEYVFDDPVDLFF